MTTADTMQLRDFLLVELRASTAPLSTADLAARMPWKVEVSHDSCAQLCHRPNLEAGVKVQECRSSWHVVQYRRTTHGYTGVYRHLRSLESHGVIRRAISNGRKSVCWTYIGPPAPGPAAPLGAQSEQPCEGGGRR